MKTFLLFTLFVPLWVYAQLSLPSIFSDHMVPQRDQPIQLMDLLNAAKDEEI